MDSSKRAVILSILLVALSGVFRIGLCLPSIDNSYSLSYGAASGKGHVVQPMRMTQQPTKTQSIPVQSPPITTTKTLVEVTPMKSAMNLPVPIPAPIPVPAPLPKKQHEPVCIDPFTLGIPTVQNCGDLKIMGAAEGTLVYLQEGFENCALMDDISCDNGSGEGLRSYQARLSKAGGIPIQHNPGVGPCLSVDRRPDGSLDIKASVGWTSSILCCRPVCYRTSSTTPIPIMMPQTQPQHEALLPLEDVQQPTPPPLRPTPPIYTTPSPTVPLPFAGITAQIPIVTTPTPPYRAAFGEMCVMPKFLDLPRVTTCEDLRDLALSTSVVELVNLRAADCAWTDDPTCGPAYPGLGAYIEGGVPDGACLAFRQTHCGNVVGPFPILGKHTKDICRRTSSAQGKGGASGMQMMPMMMMPMPAPSKGKGGRRLQDVTTDKIFVDADGFVSVAAAREFTSAESEFRRLHGKGAPSKGVSGGGASSDTVILCCRLQCNGGSRTGTSVGSTSIVASMGGGGSLFQLMPSSGNSQGAAPEMRGFAGITGGRGDSFGGSLASASNRMAIGGESDLCNARYSIICSLATPLNGEQIVFDQRCVTQNLPGCYAGGMPCCRSVSLFGY